MRFSQRLNWHAPVNEIARRVAERPPLYDLTESNPTRAGFAYPSSVLEAFANPRALQYVPDARGLAEVRALVGADFLTASSSESYSYILKLLCDPGDEILVPRPSYPLFDYLAHLDSVRTVQYPLFYDHGWHVDIGALRAAVTERTRAIVIVNPNNPTGSYLKPRELEDLEALGLPLISDEVFACYPLTDEPRVTCVAAVSKVLSFSLGGLSKEAGMPQMKLGWIRVGGEGREAAVERLELIADTYLSAGTPVQLAAHALLNCGVREQIHERVRANLALVPEALHAEGGWYAILRLPPVRTEDEWVLHLLDAHGVYAQPGYYFDFDSSAPHAVVSLLTLPEVFAAGMAKIRSALGTVW
ncbi:aminotransferase [Bryobacterales bacterium F-183]|nr:aminotransferase [Bryobacterales bacterium F-183]